MKKIIVLLALLVSSSVFAQNTGALKFGVMTSNPNTPESMKVFLKFLAEKTGADFELVISDLDSLLKGLASGEIAFADLTSGGYNTANTLYKDKIRYVATVAARNEKGELVPYYKGLFFALKSNPYNSMLDLKGRSFAFVSQTSTSGYLYPVATLNSMGIVPDDFFGSITFSGSHEKIFEGLKVGFLDAGVSNYDAFEKAKALHGNIFKIIGETAQIPSGAFVASAKVDPKLIRSMQSVLVKIKPVDPVVNYPGFLYKGWLVKDSSFYRLVKKIMQ